MSGTCNDLRNGLYSQTRCELPAGHEGPHVGHDRNGLPRAWYTWALNPARAREQDSRGSIREDRKERRRLSREAADEDSMP